MNCIGTYDGTIFYNPANKFCIVSVKTADQSVPAEARVKQTVQRPFDPLYSCGV